MPSSTGTGCCSQGRPLYISVGCRRCRVSIGRAVAPVCSTQFCTLHLVAHHSPCCPLLQPSRCVQHRLQLMVNHFHHIIHQLLQHIRQLIHETLRHPTCVNHAKHLHAMTDAIYLAATLNLGWVHPSLTHSVLCLFTTGIPVPHTWPREAFLWVTGTSRRAVGTCCTLLLHQLLYALFR